MGFEVAVHIGYHKTATKWFQRVAFPRHEQIVPLLGESSHWEVGTDAFAKQIVFNADHEFDAAKARAMLCERTAQLVTRSDQVLLVSAERLSGNAASGGFDARRIAERLFATIPEARVFWLLRHQAEAIKSGYKQLVRTGWPGNVTATLTPPQRRRTVGFDLVHWEYDRLARVYAGLFGGDNVLVIDYGTFVRERTHTLKALATFLGVHPWELSTTEMEHRVNVSISDREVRVRQLLNHFTRSELNPYPLFRLPARMATSIIKNSKYLSGDYQLFDDGFDQWVQKRFAESNLRLSEERGIELTRSAGE
ncbi:MAG: sulfotransferase [Nitrososphaerales archaeon]